MQKKKKKFNKIILKDKIDNKILVSGSVNLNLKKVRIIIMRKKGSLITLHRLKIVYIYVINHQLKQTTIG